MWSLVVTSRGQGLSVGWMNDDRLSSLIAAGIEHRQNTHRNTFSNISMSFKQEFILGFIQLSALLDLTEFRNDVTE